MAILIQDRGALRLVLRLVGRGAGPQGPGPWLATAALEYRDQRDGEWWPLVAVPPFELPAPAAEALRTSLLELVRGAVPGFAWRAGGGEGEGEEAPLALQLGAAPGGAVVELGMDLGRFLAEVAGAPARPGAELALFRFPAAQQALVVFADELGRELAVEVPPA